MSGNKGGEGSFGGLKQIRYHMVRLHHSNHCLGCAVTVLCCIVLEFDGEAMAPA